MAKMAAAAAGGGGVKVLMTIVVVILFSLATGGKGVVAEVHHVVGDDQGWKPSTDLVSWFTGRVFRVGDKIWFAYTDPNESIMELQTAEEFNSCDLTNPIRMYTDGLDKVSLDGEGIRYFTSGNPASCKNGLKLPVNVQPRWPDSPYLPKPPSPHWPTPDSPPTPTPHFPFTPTPPSPRRPTPDSPPFTPTPHTPHWPTPDSPPFTPTPPSPPPPHFPFPPSPPSPPPPTPHYPFPPTPPSPPPPTPHTPPPPSPPSSSAHFTGLSFALFVGFVLCYLGI